MPFSKPLTAFDVEAIPLISRTNVENAEPVDTCSLYEVAPVEALQLIVGFVATPVVPFAGEASTGAGGMTGAEADVVKLQTDDHALEPAVLLALTRQ